MTRDEGMDDDYAADVARKILDTLAAEVPDDFPRDAMPTAVPGVHIKLGVRLVDGRYIAGETAEERYERWVICEDLAQQLLDAARKDSAKNPANNTEQTLERVRVSVARKGWVSPEELDWLMQRLRTLLERD